MSVTGEFGRYLATAIDACQRVDEGPGRRLLAELEAARAALGDDLSGAAQRTLAALDAHLPALEAEAPAAAEEAAAAARDLLAVSRIVVGG